MNKVVIVGAAKLNVRGIGTIQVDDGREFPFNGGIDIGVKSHAHLTVKGQVIAHFSATGSFVADGVRVITNGQVCVNMLEEGQVYTGGPGLVFAEGCHARVDNGQTVLAVNCPAADVHDNATLIASDCEQVEAYDESNLIATRCKSVLAVEQSTLNATDCGEVRIDEGDNINVPKVKLVRCEREILVHLDFAIEDGITEQVYVESEAPAKAA